jgi:hypothetical protein
MSSEEGIISFSKYFVLNAELLSKKTGKPVVYSMRPYGTYVVYSAHDAIDSLLEIQEKYHTKYIIMQSENVEASCFKNPQYIELLKKNIVFQYSKETAIKCMEKYDVFNTDYFKFEYPKVEVTGVRDIDLLFFGCLNQRRHDIMHYIQNKFPKKNIVITSDAFGEDLHNLLVRTKTVINISFYPNAVLETHRVAYALSYGCSVISNRSADPDLDSQYPSIHFCDNNLPEFTYTVKQFI